MMLQQKYPSGARRRLRTGGTPVSYKRQHCTLVLVKQHLGRVGVTKKGMPAGRKAHDAPTKVPFRGAPLAANRGNPRRPEAPVLHFGAGQAAPWECGCDRERHAGGQEGS